MGPMCYNKLGLYEDKSMKKALLVGLCFGLMGCAGLKTSAEYVARANGYVKDGKPTQAVEAYNRAVVLNPRNLDAYEGRGAAYYFKGQFELAQQDFERVLQADPYRVSVYTAYASALAAQGNFEQALVALDVSAQLRPNQAETYFARAGVYYMLGKYDLAVADYTRTLQLRPAADVFNARGAAYLKWGQREQAEQDFKTAKTANIPQHLNDLAGL